MWLRLAVLVNALLAVASALRLGAVVAFEQLPAPTEAAYLDLALAFAQFPALAWLCMRLFKLVLDKAGARRFPSIARHLVGVLLHAVMLALAVRLVFDQSLETVVAASGVITVVLGFALRGLLADLFSGIVLSVDRDIGVDDIIEFSIKNRHVVGQIVEFNWRTFKIRDLNDHVLLIPNSEFSSLMVINHSRSASCNPCRVVFPMPARCDSDKAMRVLRGTLERELLAARVRADPAPYVEILSATQGTLYFEAHFMPAAPHTEHRVTASLYQAGLRDLRLAGLALSVPGDTIANSIAATAPQADGAAQPLLQALRRVGLLTPLSEVQRTELARQMVRHEYAQGTVIVDEGQAGSSMFLVMEGVCEVLVGSEGQWRHVAYLWPGEHFGEMSLLTGRPRSARVCMHADGVLLELPKDALGALFAASPELLAKVSASVVARSEESEAVRRGAPAAAPQEHASRVEAVLLQMRRFFGLAGGHG